MKPQNYVHLHDADLTIWYDNPVDPVVTETRNIIIKKLRARGFRIETCPRIAKDYPVLKQWHHSGHIGDLKVHVELAGRTIKVEFWQEINVENRNGGRYDFRRRERMPYLIGKRFELERKKLLELCAERGLPVLPSDPPPRGIEYIRFRQGEVNGFHRRDLAAKIEPYNARMRSGELLMDGEEVYFWDYLSRGYIMRGTAHYNINNMWWVLLPSGEIRNIACFDLYRRADIVGPLKGRRFNPHHVEKTLSRLKDAAVQSENYERAAVLRDLLKVRAAA